MPDKAKENLLLARGLAFCSAKPGGKSSPARQEGSHFAPQNQEENPLLARGLAFAPQSQERKILCSPEGSHCSAKLGRIDMLLQHERIWITGHRGRWEALLPGCLIQQSWILLLTDIDEVDITDMDAVRNYARNVQAGLCH